MRSAKRTWRARDCRKEVSQCGGNPAPGSCALAAAEEIAKHTLKQARVLNNALIITQCLNDLARLSLRFGRLDEAGQYNREAVKMEEEGLDHLGLLESTLISARIQTEQYDFAQA